MNDGNAAHRVIQDLRNRIATAVPGARLPSVRELTASHQASPVTVAEAIRTLVAQGLVETRSGRATFVASRPDQRQAADLGWQTVALGPRPHGDAEMQALLAMPPAGA